MSLKFAFPMAFAVASLSLAGTAAAQTYAGGTTAGNLPASAEVVPGVAGVTYTAISGQTTPITSGDNVYNAEMYEITLGVAEFLTASTTKFTPGANDFDDQLFLLNSSGVGVLSNDDAASGGDQASFSTSTTLLAPGNYYLLVTGSGSYPIDSTGALLFPNYTQSGVAKDGTYAATSTLSIANYTGSTNYGGNYVIALTLTPQSVIPEPGSTVFALAGVSGLALVFRARRQNTRESR